LNKQPYIVGLTGGIGSGKSTVSRGFQKFGIAAVDADYASRAVVEPGMPALSEIAQHFGDNFLLANGELDRAALRAVIFADAEEKAWLERLLHPLIRDWIMGQLQSAKGPYVILESPLLFETNQFQLVNTVLLIDLPVELQLERASMRDSSEIEQIQHIIDSQMSRKEKLSKADWIFDNALNQDTMTKRIETLHAEFLALANSKN
jgi:dephospho-CoA kinase